MVLCLLLLHFFSQNNGPMLKRECTGGSMSVLFYCTSSSPLRTPAQMGGQTYLNSIRKDPPPPPPPPPPPLPPSLPPPPSTVMVSSSTGTVDLPYLGKAGHHLKLHSYGKIFVSLWFGHQSEDFCQCIGACYAVPIT